MQIGKGGENNKWNIIYLDLTEKILLKIRTTELMKMKAFDSSKYLIKSVKGPMVR